MNQKKLSEVLSGVVENCVNKVGVDLNTASVSLLEYVSGVSKAVAKNIVAYREENGRFNNRKELLKVPKLGPKAFEQCAGFLRIREGDNPLDATGVHPESYEVTKLLLEKLNLTLEDVKEIQAKALKNKGLTSTEKTKPERKSPKKKQGIVIKNQNTALGKALAAAVSDLDQSIPSNDNSTNRNIDRESSVEHTAIGMKIKDKSKMAKELEW